MTGDMQRNCGIYVIGVKSIIPDFAAANRKQVHLALISVAAEGGIGDVE